MEEDLIRDFIHRVLRDEQLRKGLATDPESTIARENFTPRVVRVIRRMVPQLAFGEPQPPAFTWW